LAGRGKGRKLGEPSLRLSQDRMPVVPPSLAAKLGEGVSWVKGKGSKLGEASLK
jgi:hypothetical protein